MDKSRILVIHYGAKRLKEPISGLSGSRHNGITLKSAYIYLLQKIIKLNIPVISDYITDIVAIVQTNLQNPLTFIFYKIYITQMIIKTKGGDVMIEVSTSILNVDEEEAMKAFYDLEVAKTDYYHIDVMDGKFVRKRYIISYVRLCK